MVCRALGPLDAEDKLGVEQQAGWHTLLVGRMPPGQGAKSETVGEYLALQCIIGAEI